METTRLCECGCGLPTGFPTGNHSKAAKLIPNRFVRGHGARGSGIDPAERFWRYVRKTDDGCWLWSGSKNNNGYGRFRVSASVEKLAHRYSFALHKGVIPEGAFILHSCDTPACVNPAHLSPGDQVQNMAEMQARGRRTPHPTKDCTHCLRGHEYTEANTIRTAKGRCCRTCKAASDRNGARGRERAARRAGREFAKHQAASGHTMPV